MKALRDFLDGHAEVLFDALELSTCGFYLRRIDAQTDTGNGLDQPLMISRQCLNSLGIDSENEECTLEQWLGFMHADDWTSVAPHFHNVANVASRTLTYRLRRSDGTYRYTRESGRKIEPKGSVGVYWLGILRDIDNETRIANELARKNRENEAILNTIPTYIWFKDIQHRILKCNRAAADASGLAVDQIEGRLTSEVYPELGHHYESSDKKVMGSQTVNNSVEDMISRTGERRRMLIDKYNVDLGDGAGNKILVVGTDVTEVEQNEIALKESEAQFRRLFDHSPLGMILVDQKGKIDLANESAEAIFHYPSGGLVGLGVESLVPAGLRAGHVDYRSSFQSSDHAKGMEPQREFPGLCADGDRIFVQVALTRLTIKGDTMTLATVTDITARREMTMRLDLAIGVGNVGFWDYNVRLKTVETSPQLLNQLGRDEPWQSVDDFVRFLHKDDTEQAVKNLRNYVESGGEGVYESVFRLAHGNGGFRWILSRGTAIKDDAGEVERMVGFHIDITEQRNVQSELERSNHDLDRFAYIASHDLKAPLRGIMHLSQWITEDLEESSNPDIKTNLRLLASQTKRMNMLLDDLLAYARVGRQSVSVEHLDLKTTIRELFAFMTPPASVRLEIEGTLPIFRTYRSPLKQVFRNLIGNAITHAGDGDRIITVSCDDADHEYRFCVADDGVGIDPRFHEKVFHLFETLSVKDSNHGTGMGLALVRRLVENVGCRVWLESTPGVGAQFFFTWPKKQIDEDSAV